MVTLILFAASVFASCLAAAGLIASAQNDAHEARTMAGLETGRDANA
jgi:hypothetical protein